MRSMAVLTGHAGVEAADHLAPAGVGQGAGVARYGAGSGRGGLQPDFGGAEQQEERAGHLGLAADAQVARTPGGFAVAPAVLAAAARGDVGDEGREALGGQFVDGGRGFAVVQARLDRKSVV